MHPIADCKNQNIFPTIEPSKTAKNTTNPIRQLVDRSKSVPPTDREFISLSIGNLFHLLKIFSVYFSGDPTIFGNFNTHPNVIQAVQDELLSMKHNGYPPAIGKQNIKQRNFY